MRKATQIIVQCQGCKVKFLRPKEAKEKCGVCLSTNVFKVVKKQR